MISPRLQAIIDKAKQRTAELQAAQTVLPSATEIDLMPPSVHTMLGYKDPMKEIESFKGDTSITLPNGTKFDPYSIPQADGSVLTLNEEQSRAVDWFGIQGKSGCLIGPAGTGKTTTMKAVIRAAILCGRIPTVPTEDKHKYLPTGKPGIWGGSFTRIATRNLRDNFPDELKSNVHTIHRLLEFEPEIVTVPVKDEKGVPTGDLKDIRIFKPTRHATRPLSEYIKMYNFDEGSMVGCELYNKYQAAKGDKDAQELLIGDIAQLPPVMDDSILGYKLLELPVVELIHVYRHAGRIVNLANHIRLGNTIPDAKFVMPYAANLTKMLRKIVEEGIAQWNGEEDGSKVTIHLWKNRITGGPDSGGFIRALQNLSNFFSKEIKENSYNPLTDMILIPYNKAVGTIELNKYISNFLGKQRDATVYEVIAGFNKHYFAVGDKVFFDREEAIITKIAVNANYSGKVPQAASVTLDRWGHNQSGEVKPLDIDEMASIDALLRGINVEDEEERKNQASHVIYVKKIRDMENPEDIEPEDEEDAKADGHSCRTTSEVNSLIGGYALTIHKSQGSQWKKVYCVFHNSHNRNLQRELLYTAITRAQKELYVIAEPETFIQGVTSQHIIGNTLAQKAEYFKGKVKDKAKRDLLFNSVSKPEEEC